ncbi:hypothetical protein [Erythrobacter sp. BLCC-B19]|uniref:hypothetical protein n=1 Tax=Erythrobacter sp. BLCC-B19 TaxID=3025315 RepID=UPI002361BEB1|nr:hypothetical protein [Erythrobacter sp. BLCC-B19]WDA39985.1 hypothetical protein PS060_10445 [Erythrobacter sp. BLCC-B19]
MTRLSARLIRFAAPAFAVALAPALAAQQTFELPPASPSPTPAPAGPADERAGVAIPPRAQPSSAPEVIATPVIQPLPSPTAGARAGERPTPRASTPQPQPGATATTQPTPVPAGAGDGAETGEAPAPAVTGVLPTLPGATGTPAAAPGFGTALDPATPMTGALVLPDWWPYAAGGLGALVLLGGGLVWQRRRGRKPLRLAAPPAGADAGQPQLASGEQPRLDLTLEITSATRSVMMFSVGWRLTIANRSDRAVNDVSAAVQLACARASAGAGNAPSPGAAQGLAAIDRIGPQQARSLTGTVQLPLSAIAPLRQGTTPLFVPLAHVTLEGEGLRAMTRSFVIGPRSPSGRVHPIALDQPPGSIAGLVAQIIATAPETAAA